MGVNTSSSEYIGFDGSESLLSNETVTSSDQIRFIFDTAKKNRWASAVSNKYKLVVSKVSTSVTS